MPLPGEHTQAPILTQWTVFVGHLGFQSITDQYERPCRKKDGHERSALPLFKMYHDHHLP